ncbi:hypothetical protein DFQ26_001845, partial [Actinomortierella ambigua]
MFATVDRPSSANASAYRPRYSAKVRYEPTQRREPPPVMLQHKLKPWKPPPVTSNDAEPKSKKPPAPIRPQIHDCLERGRMLDEMMWEHPTVTLDLGGLKENVNAVVSDPDTSQTITNCIQEAVREASSVKRRGQELIGKYILEVFYPRPGPSEPRPDLPQVVTNSTDIAVLDQLCPRFAPSKSGRDEEKDSDVEDGLGEGQKTRFLQMFLNFLYSGNTPILRLPKVTPTASTPSASGSSTTVKKLSAVSKPSVATTATNFIYRLQELNLLPTPDKSKVPTTRNIVAFAPSSLVRSVATQLSAELKRQYMVGCEELSKK